MEHSENTRVKIPALVHFTRLGYKYLSLKEEKENILEDGEIEEEDNKEKDNENKNNLLGNKRERKSNIKKRLGKNKKEIKENKNEYGFKKGFKYKSNNLYDELIKKEKI